MHRYVRRGLQSALLVGGGILLTAGIAAADDTSGSDSLLGGNQVTAPVSVPVNVLDNAVGVVGDSVRAGSSTPAPKPAAPAPAQRTTTGSDSAGGGNQVTAPVAVPVTIGGNAVGAAGDPVVVRPPAAAQPAPAPAQPQSTASTTDGSDSVAGGNQVTAPVSVPVTIGGNAIGAAGDPVVTGGQGGTSAPATGGAESADTTDGSDSVGGGNQVTAPVSVPVTIGGNAIGAAGDPVVAGGQGGSSTPPADGGQGTSTTDGSDSVGGGNQVTAPVTIPVTIGGNAIGAAGDPVVTGGQGDTATPPADGGQGTSTTDGSDSVGGGNQVTVPIRIPVTVDGNAVGVVGDPVVTTEGTTDPTDPVDPTDPTEPTDPGTGEGPVPGGDGSADVPGADGAAAPSGDASLIASAIPSAGQLAYTGSDAGLLLVALLLLVAGGVLLLLRRSLPGRLASQ